MRCHFWTTLKVAWFQIGPSSLIALFVILKQLSPNFQKKLSSSSHEVKQPQKQQDKMPKHVMETWKHTNIYNNIPSLCNEKKKKTNPKLLLITWDQQKAWKRVMAIFKICFKG